MKASGKRPTQAYQQALGVLTSATETPMFKRVVGILRILALRGNTIAIAMSPDLTSDQSLEHQAAAIVRWTANVDEIAKCVRMAAISDDGFRAAERLAAENAGRMAPVHEPTGAGSNGA